MPNRLFSASKRSGALLLVLALIAVAVSVFVEHRRVIDSNRIAASHSLALQGAKMRSLDWDMALTLGAAALKIHSDDGTRTAFIDTMLAKGRITVASGNAISAVALSGDGKTVLVSTFDGKVELWSLEGWNVESGIVELSTLKGFDDDVTALAMTPDGNTAVTGNDASGDGRTIVWDLSDKANPEKVAEWTESTDFFTSEVQQVALTPNGKLALVAREGGTISVWDLSKKKHPVRLSTLKIQLADDGDESVVSGLEVSADGSTAIVAGNTIGVVWDLTDKAHPVRRGTLRGTGFDVRGVALSADGHTAVTGGLTGSDWLGAVNVWDLTNRSSPLRLAALPGLMSEAYNVALTPDGRRALAGGFGGKTILWNLDDRSHPFELATLKGPVRMVEFVALNADGTTLISSTPTTLHAWNIPEIDKDPLREACAQSLIGEIDKQSWKHISNGEPWPDYLDDQARFYPCK